MATTDLAQQNSLAEQLSMCDESFPREPPTWDKDAIVTPRSFLTEIGYDISDGEQIPEDLGRFLIETAEPAHVLTCCRTFSDEGFSEGLDRSLLDRDAYNTVRVYRVDDQGDAPIFERYGRGVLVEYSYIREESRRTEAGHARYGYYWLDLNGRNELVTKLLCGPDEGPWDSGEDRSIPSYAVPSWKTEANPAAEETWMVAYVDDTEITGRLSDLAGANLAQGAIVEQEGEGPITSSIDTPESSD